MSETAESAPASRPRLNLKPRDESAAKQLELRRTASGKNPFGDAKPREAVLASRTGKSETEILVEEVKSEKPKLRLNAQQLEEKRAAEAAVTEIQELLAAEPTEAGQQPLKEELSARQAALDKLMEDFEKLALEAAVKGDFLRPSERRRQQQMLLESQGSIGDGYGSGDPSYRGSDGHRGGGSSGLARQGSGNYGGGAGGGGGGGGGFREDWAGGYREGSGRGGSYRDGGGYDRRGGGYGGRGGYDRGHRGFSNYEERGSFDEEGRGGRGGYQDRGGYFERDGGRGGYEPRDYRGPSDYDNVETFGAGAAGYGRDRMRGGGRGGGRGGRSDRPYQSYNNYGSDGDYVSPYSSEVQDRY